MSYNRRTWLPAQGLHMNKQQIGAGRGVSSAPWKTLLTNRKTDNTNALHKRILGFLQNLPENPSLNVPFALPSGALTADTYWLG